MASMTRPQQDYQPQYQYQHRPTEKVTPSSSQVLALSTLVPLGAFLLLLSGVTLTGTVIGLAVTTPLFVIFSPVLLPAVLVIGLAVTGFLASGAFGVTALSSFAWLTNYVRGSRWPEQPEHAKRPAEETMGHVAKRTKEVGEAELSKAQETGQAVQNEACESEANTQTRAREQVKTS